VVKYNETRGNWPCLVKYNETRGNWPAIENEEDDGSYEDDFWFFNCYQIGL